MDLSDKIKVSVVVPVYNVEQYLERCLNSLVGQTLADIEILVVNDGSKDHSQEIIERFAAEYPGKIRAFQKPNGGLSDARNFGIPHCRGEYIGFIDSDDYVDTDMFETMYREAERQNADMVACDYVKEYSTQTQVVHARAYTSSKDMFIGGLASACNKIYRREIITENHLEFPRGLIYEDTEFFCKLIPLVEKCGYVAKPFVHYVQRSGSIANSQSRKVMQIFSIFQDIFRYYQDEKILDAYHPELEYFCTRIAFGSHFERVSRISDRKDRHQAAVETFREIRKLFPDYRGNSYIVNTKSLRHLFIRLLRPWNAGLASDLLHLIYMRRDKVLF